MGASKAAWLKRRGEEAAAGEGTEAGTGVGTGGEAATAGASAFQKCSIDEKFDFIDDFFAVCAGGEETLEGRVDINRREGGETG